MDNAARRKLLTVSAVTAGTLILSPVIVTPHQTPVPIRVSSASVQLTDAWSQLINDTIISTYLLGQLAVGANSTYPLPNPIFIAPVAAQLVINPLIYAVQLVTGQGANVPAAIIAHINNVADVAAAIGKDVPPAIAKQIQTPFIAAKDAIESITASGNPLLGLLEAPAVFLNEALNSEYGLLSLKGPIAVGFIIRNVLATALYTAPPAVVLPFKKPAATLSPTVTATTGTPKAAAPSGTASSARPKPKASAGSGRTAAAAKASDTKSGAHSRRG
ncbi:hypothetical protein [Mycolicibacterium rhodesiae]|uniref:Uncharacterized protein n=1 Tax=Mycolicibacterium rhodesiae TaxID=36814 RepID=A0A1X0IKI4_MYCRH|nr:hypothetical protein [Mycolicibacterium rhodesiae]MCV7348487.1 hypothetical protein [Mycolicibacterium rhodesiae]ORB48480.1 hypothetical protein BST42_25330 [Mycolicibacterium rhodesiae]